MASAYGSTLSNFLGEIAPGISIAYRDLNYGLELSLERALSRGTGVSLQRIRSHALAAPDKGSTAQPPRADREWVLDPAIGRGVICLPGQTYCPICLAEDTVPYLRRRWRRYYITLCDVHGTALLDRCIHCDTPVNLRWADRAPFVARLAAPVTLCSQCGRDLREAVEVAKQRHGASEDLAAMRFLMETVRAGWAVRPGQEPIRAHLYLPVVIALCMEDIGGSLEGLVARVGGPQHSLLPDRIQGFVQPRKRRERIRSILWLLEDWPDRFVELCWLAEVSPVRLLWSIQPPVPFWYWSVVAENVYDPNLQRDRRELDWMDLQSRAAAMAARTRARKAAQETISGTRPTPPPLPPLRTNDDLFTYFRADLPPVLRAAGRLRFATRYQKPGVHWLLNRAL